MHSNNNQAESEALRYRACPLDGSLGQGTCKPSSDLHQWKKWFLKRSVLKSSKVPVLADWQHHWQANSINFVCWGFSVNHGRHSIFWFGTFVALLKSTCLVIFLWKFSSQMQRHEPFTSIRKDCQHIFSMFLVFLPIFWVRDSYSFLQNYLFKDVFLANSLRKYRQHLPWWQRKDFFLDQENEITSHSGAKIAHVC